jgi:hypothetical protein
VQRYAYNTSFSIDFFMGTPEPNPTLRPTASNLIGSHAQFIAYNISMMFPTGPPQGLVQGHVSLSHTLVVGLDRGLLLDLSPQHVVPLLAKQLQWNARSPDGSDVNVKALKGLSIAVSSRTVKPAISVSEFPRMESCTGGRGLQEGRLVGSGCLISDPGMSRRYGAHRSRCEGRVRLERGCWRTEVRFVGAQNGEFARIDHEL